MLRTENGKERPETKQVGKRVLALLLAALLLPVCALSGAARDFVGTLLDTEDPWTAEVSVQFQTYMPYGEERLRAFNDLWKHLSLRLSKAGELSGISLLTDQAETLGAVLSRDPEAGGVQFSFAPETVYTPESLLLSGEATEALPLSALPGSFADVSLSRGSWLRFPEDGFALLERLPALYPEYTKETKTKTKLRDVGTSVLKAVVTLPREAVEEEGVMTRLTEACENAALKDFLSGLVFSGRQRITLYLDENRGLMKAGWSGQAGFPEDIRKVTLEWRGLRGEERSWDELTWKLPAVSGSNQDAGTLTMETRWEGQASPEGAEGVAAARTEQTTLSLSWSRTRNRQRTKLKGSLSSVWGDQAVISGDMQFTGTNLDEKRSLAAELHVLEPLRWEGTVQLRQETNGAPQTDALWQLKVQPGAELTWQQTATRLDVSAMAAEERTTLEGELQTRMAAELLRALLSLPDEDLNFVNDELDPEAWQQVRRSGAPASEGGPVE